MKSKERAVSHGSSGSFHDSTPDHMQRKKKTTKKQVEHSKNNNNNNFFIANNQVGTKQVGSGLDKLIKDVWSPQQSMSPVNTSIRYQNGRHTPFDKDARPCNATIEGPTFLPSKRLFPVLRPEPKPKPLIFGSQSSNLASASEVKFPPLIYQSEWQTPLHKAPIEGPTVLPWNCKTFTSGIPTPKVKPLKKKSALNDRKEGKKKAAKGQPSKCLCGICFDFKPASAMLNPKCNHPFCTLCISEYVATQIKQNVLKVNCPNPTCSVELEPAYLQPIMPAEVIDRWEAARCESSIASWQKTYCPFKNCSVLLVNDGEVVTSSECPSCHRLFCAQCKVPWHAEMDCKEFQKLERGKREQDSDRKFLELAKWNKWKKCPKCSMYVERHSGCEHMTCRCGSNFCYKCGKNWMFGHICHSHSST